MATPAGSLTYNSLQVESSGMSNRDERSTYQRVLLILKRRQSNSLFTLTALHKIEASLSGTFLVIRICDPLTKQGSPGLVIPWSPQLRCRIIPDLNGFDGLCNACRITFPVQCTIDSLSNKCMLLFCYDPRPTFVTRAPK